MLHAIVLQDQISDRWRWLLGPINGYSVKGTCRYLTMVDALSDQVLLVDVWQKQLPIKVSLFAWRLFRNRLPTKDNLLRRHILPSDDNLCVDGCGSVETTDHLIFLCDTSERVWSAVLQWLHLSFVAPIRSKFHFLQFGHTAGLPHSSFIFFQIIWRLVSGLFERKGTITFSFKRLQLHKF